MAHFVELDQNNLVLRVVVIDNEDCHDDDGNESEAVGVEFCQSLFGSDTIWKQTSYNSSMRKNYAGVGFTYDVTRDAFIPPCPFPSWVFNEESCNWDAPVARPDDDKRYTWDELNQQWVEVTD